MNKRLIFEMSEIRTSHAGNKIKSSSINKINSRQIDRTEHKTDKREFETMSCRKQRHIENKDITKDM